MSNFTVESWSWFGVVIFMYGLRMLARLLHFKSILRLQVEDWLMMFLICLYTILIVFLNVQAVAKTNLVPPDQIASLTPEDIKERTWGSRTVVLVEQCMCSVQWGTKTCLLILYWRLTQNLTQNVIVKLAALYVGLTFLVMEIFYFCVWCRPFHDYWKTPCYNVECTTAIHHLIMNCAFNLSSDLLIMSIPLPLLLKAHLEVKRKILLVFPFTLGTFTIICAILSKHLSFTQPFSGYWVFWYCREASTAMIVANMPYSWSLIRRAFSLRSFWAPTDDPTAVPGRASVITLQGVSVPDTSQATSGARSQRRISKLFGDKWRVMKERSHGSSTGQDSVVTEEASAPSAAWQDVKDKDLVQSNSQEVPSSRETSADEIATMPMPSQARQSIAAAAVDKMYRLDDLEDDGHYQENEKV